MEDGFTAVSKGGRKSRRKNKYVVQEKTVDDYLAILAEKRDKLARSKFMEKLREIFEEFQLPEIKSIRCLALGPPSDTASTMPAMYQLALLQILAEQLDVPETNVSVWDPVFSDMDKTILEKSGYLVAEEFPSSVELDTCLFYMPHAPLSLTNDTLASLAQAKTSIILGNLLTTYDTRVSPRDLEQKYPYLNTAMKDMFQRKSWSFQQIPDNLSKHEHFFQAVNDLALHYRSLNV
ncbi:hypothetical protein TRICI_002439 [Trichomonascus ciferrii]|uniref:SRR1-like domain-containing protein n=1 Tax=Trichomonascus ciferrii TaxID=44093 RepID=A0A642V6K7_9ASCO|nr:hypothetical protein TRICI_002439 [Trichomonascus ciferrii]